MPRVPALLLVLVTIAGCNGLVASAPSNPIRIQASYDDGQLTVILSGELGREGAALMSVQTPSEHYSLAALPFGGQDKLQWQVSLPADAERIYIYASNFRCNDEVGVSGGSLYLRVTDAWLGKTIERVADRPSGNFAYGVGAVFRDNEPWIVATLPSDPENLRAVDDELELVFRDEAMRIVGEAEVDCSISGGVKPIPFPAGIFNWNVLELRDGQGQVITHYTNEEGSP